jgi:hypothetical protein
MLALAFLLLFNFVHLRNASWVALLALLALLAYVGVRRGFGSRVAPLLFLSFCAVAFVVFLKGATVRAFPSSVDASLYSWVERETPKDALFVVPPGMQAFRLEARRSVFVDFKTFPGSQPAVAWEWRQRLEEVVGYDAKALEQGQGWPGLVWWDRAYAKRNPPDRILGLLTSTGADFFVVDRLYQQLPPHLPLEEGPGMESGLELAFENSRYRVYGRAVGL